MDSALELVGETPGMPYFPPSINSSRQGKVNHEASLTTAMMPPQETGRSAIPEYGNHTDMSITCPSHSQGDIEHRTTLTKNGKEYANLTKRLDVDMNPQLRT